MSCSNEACDAALGATNSLRQGEQFAAMTRAYHGGRRSRRMRGGAYATFPGEFGQTLPQDMHAAADIASLDKAFAQLPEFAGKYGMAGGARRSRKQRGGVAPVDAPGMILSPMEEGQAFLNPQWYNENLVNPNFRGPVVQKAGKASRKHRKASRKAAHRKAASRKARKVSRKHRKAASRKARKVSRKHRKASRKAAHRK
jgi:hypothetical protein